MASYGRYNEYADQGFANSRWDYDALKNLRKISPVVQTHLKRVYLTLACALIASAVGVYLHLLWNVGGILTVIACLASIAWLLSTPPYPYNEGKRVKLLMAAAVCEGASFGPLVDVVINIDLSIVVMALVGTGLAFACFSAAAILARRREYIFLGALLASGLSVLLWLNFASALFGGSTEIFMFEIYFGVLLFIGYIIFDTQMIIERADLGDYDYVKHSLELFTDFAALLTRVLIILANNSAKKEKKKRRD